MPFGSELPSHVQVIPDTSAEAEPLLDEPEFPDFSNRLPHLKRSMEPEPIH